MGEHITIRPITRDETEAVQAVFNDKAVIADLGGFTMTDTVKQAAFGQRPGLLAAFNEMGEPVGAMMAGGRPQVHLLKYGSVGVLPAWRRRRISTALYAGFTLQGIVEGRRLFEDTIVGDNDVQHLALPTMGLYKAGTLRHRTASGKDIVLYQMSMIDGQIVFENLMARTEGSPYQFRWFIDDNDITRDWFEKNNEIVDKNEHLRKALGWLGTTRWNILNDVYPTVTAVRNRIIPPAPQKGQKSPAAETLKFW